MKKIIIITGAPGTGKTETARRLVNICPENSAWLDTDKIVGIKPFTIEEKFFDLLYNNLKACIENFTQWGASNIIVSGVILPTGIYHRFKKLNFPGYEVKYYGLTATAKTIIARIDNDDKGQDSKQRKEYLFQVKEVHEIENCRILDTTRMRLDNVVKKIALLEGWIQKPAPASKTISIPVKKLLDHSVMVLKKHGVSEPLAKKIAHTLLQNELSGYASHGLIRLKEYTDDLKKGIISNNRKPIFTALSSDAGILDANRCWGILSADAVCSSLQKMLRTRNIAIIGLKNSNHIGRLASIAENMTKRGFMVIGFANYLGAGQRSPVYGGTEGRLCTNPLLIGIPNGSKAPVILDMTTTAASEGKIRVYDNRNEPVPPGLLIDKSWNTVTEAKRLYTNPPTAFLAPLGGNVAYKGTGLALCIEILAGIITQAGFSGAEAIHGGNGGLFIGIRPEALGLSRSKLTRHLKILFGYCRSSKMNDGYTFLYPGQHSQNTKLSLSKQKNINFSKNTWKAINELFLQ